ncbi:MAG: hypothetical protein C0508_17930, partial [Cyanobacteria bacterium PR.023]|nr:hypothetical protein [Cyanobacteria bacterium PR.023]
MIGQADSTMNSAKSRSLFDFRSSFFWLVPLLFAFVVSAWFQLRVFENKTVFLFDSAGYLVNAGDCARIIIDIFSGRLDQAWRLASSKVFVERMIVDGPTIPLFGALVFILSGKAAVATNWSTMVLWLSLLNGICAAGVSLLTKRQTDSFIFALCAGILFGLYPGTIISAGRFFTEPLTAALLMVLVLLGCYLVNCSGRFRSLVSALVIGIIAGLGVLLKTALLPAWGLLALAPIILTRGSSRSKIIGAFLVMTTGGCLMVGCWAVYTKAASGTVYLIPQRVPLLNIAVGHDLETDGWASVIGNFMAGHLATCKTSTEVLVKSWHLSPVKIADLYLRKLSRTMGFVWNDFKQPLLFLDVDGQNWLHAFLIAFASAGTLFSIRFLSKAFTSKPLDGASIYTSFACLVIVFTHAVIYLPFEANSRYGSPCVPFLFCLAAFAIREILASRRRALLLLLVLASILVVKLDLVAICAPYWGFATALVQTEVLRLTILLATLAALLTSVKSDLSQSCLDSSRFSPPVLFACALLSIFFVLLPAALTTAFIVDRRTVEIALSPGQSIARKVVLPGQSETPELAQYFLLVDCNDKFMQGHCRVNGAALPGHLISANKLDSGVYGSFNVLRMFAQAMDLSADQLRQWRIVPIPQGALRLGQANLLEISSGQTGFTLLADRLLSGENSVRLPRRKSMSLSKAYNLDARSAIESRIVDQIATPVVASSAVVADVHGRTVRKLIDIQPRLFVLKAEPRVESNSKPQDTLSSAGSLIEKTVAIAPERFDPVMYQGNSPGLIRNNRYTLAQALSTGGVVDFPAEIAAKGILELSISGEILSTGREDKAGILLA